MPIELATPKQKRQRSRPDVDPISVVSLFNRYSSYPSHGLTPERLTSIFKEADAGDVFRQSEMFEEVLEKDPKLFGMFQTRKLAVTREEYEIVGGAEDSKGDEIREYVKDVIDNCRNWRGGGSITNGIVNPVGALDGILDAVPKGFSCSWIGWQQSESDVWFDSLHWVHSKNFRWGIPSDMKSDLNEIRRLTDDNLINGIPLEPYKWVVSIIQAHSGHPARGSVLRTCAFWYLFKNFGAKAFVIFAEIFGIPFRVGKYGPGAGTPEIDALKTALRSIGIDASAVLPESTSIEFPEPPQKGTNVDIHERLINAADKQMAYAVLGHTGTSESTPGKLGGEDAAKEVKFDLVQSDAMAASHIISDQIIRPLVGFQFGPQEEYPYYNVLLKKPEDLLKEVQVDEALINAGVPLSQEYFYKRYGRPAPGEKETIVQPIQRTVTPFAPAVAKGLLGSKGDLLR